MYKLLGNFISASQILTLQKQLKREAEDNWLWCEVLRLCSRILTMPKTYQTDGQGDDAVAMLHYSLNGSDWWVTERDVILNEQIQAFGFVCLSGRYRGAELGHINIRELVEAGAQLDLYWEREPLSAIKERLWNRYRDAQVIKLCECVLEERRAAC